MTIEPHAPIMIGGYPVVAATARACSNPRNQDGSSCCYRGLALLEISSTRATVVGYNEAAGQVYSAMPTDGPQDGGRWYGPMTTSGVQYVSSSYSLDYARRIYRRLLEDREA